ncbi:Gfo/Idh/MocA family protein [Lachnoclostridium phytofermentans]|uniref:Gfo/Idh/MocA family protein n=1 Tax=Lachnoclostridium phytofermentans TaxID=66219 RepID=UPI000496A5AD|nr:Gfo/Idh/MocA family oxidoreductase [Lachnoclostridium phytofermentans]
MKKIRYAQVGIGGRARMYYEALCSTYKETCELVGFCDVSQTRMNYANRMIKEKFGSDAIPTYGYLDFQEMIEKEKPDIVIVTSIDRTHDEYIMRAMELGCDVITEKPITIDEKKAQRIIEVQKATGRNIRVAFNYRYAPHHTKIRELIMNDTIGEVYSVHFEWLLNTQHGADYYRRWHGNKLNSGGLLVHKATHHFDLVNFWLGTEPQTVFAFGDLNFYGRHNAEKRGVKNFYSRCHGNEAAKGDPFAIDMDSNPVLKGMYLDAEEDSGYIRDRSVFGDDISIEDTMAVLVRYKNNAMLSYSLNSYMPWEGFNVALNGSKGRIEYTALEKPYINAGGNKNEEGATKYYKVKVFPLFDEPYEVMIQKKEGGHGGGDPVMLDDLFCPGKNQDIYKRAANHVDGIRSILTGIAANQSISSGLPVNVDSMVKF